MFIRGRSARRRASARLQAERAWIAGRYKPSARELFPVLVERLLASRPVLGFTPETYHANETVTGGQPIFGKPTFRNVIENGVHV